MEGIFAAGFFGFFKILLVGILIWAIVFATLKKVGIFGDNQAINSLIAFISAVIVSYTGVVTYAISYAINWFVIVFFIVFLIVVFLMFLGVGGGDIAAGVKANIKPILIALGILFLIILVKGYFALSNVYDVSSPQNDSYEIDTSFNTGVGDITGVEDSFFARVDRDVVWAVIFLIVLAIFVMTMGK